MQKIYLAGPFFNEKETALIREFAARLREKYEVFVPMEHTAEGDVPEGSFAWGREIFEIDVSGLEAAASPPTRAPRGKRATPTHSASPPTSSP